MHKHILAHIQTHIKTYTHHTSTRALQVTLLGREVVNSLLTAVDAQFHPSESPEADTAPAVNSRIISLQLVPLGPSASPTDAIEYSRVRLVLHLGVGVDGVEEEQVNLLSHTFTKVSKLSQHTILKTFAVSGSCDNSSRCPL